MLTNVVKASKAIKTDTLNRMSSAAEGTKDTEGAEGASTSSCSTLAIAGFAFGLTLGAFAMQHRKTVKGYETVADETTGIKLVQTSV